ncbi:MAG: exodeoxyribonuclease VII small subunit [Burkholderiaceae bacterium]
MPRAASTGQPDHESSLEEGAGEAAPSFEQALEELETIAERMEDGSLSLDQSLAAYKRGAELVKICESALERAKEQVRVLDGELLRPLSEMPVRGSDRG